MARLHRLQVHGSRGLVSMCNAYTAAERAARAPGDDAVALKELNRRSLHVCPSGHKTEDIPAYWGRGVLLFGNDLCYITLAAMLSARAIRQSWFILSRAFTVPPILVRCLPSEASSEQQTT